MGSGWQGCSSKCLFDFFLQEIPWSSHANPWKTPSVNPLFYLPILILVCYLILYSECIKLDLNIRWQRLSNFWCILVKLTILINIFWELMLASNKTKPRIKKILIWYTFFILLASRTFSHPKQKYLGTQFLGCEIKVPEWYMFYKDNI